MKLYLGIAILALVFSGIVAMVVKSVGIKGAIVVFGLAITMSALIVLGCWLIVR